MKNDFFETSKSVIAQLEEFGFTLNTEKCAYGEIYLACSNEQDTVRITFFFGAREFFAFSVAKKNQSSSFDASYLEEILQREKIDYDPDLLTLDITKKGDDFKERYKNALHYNVEKIKELLSLGKLVP